MASTTWKGAVQGKSLEDRIFDTTIELAAADRGMVCLFPSRG